MSIDLLALEIRHERRLRLVFTNTLAIGAFNPALYTVTAVNADATSPAVTAALIVSGTPATVEIALGGDLVQGIMYTVTAVGVPATDTSVTPGGTLERFRFGAKKVKTKVEPFLRDRERLLFQVDIIWNGDSYEETASGDLARVEGQANVTKALWRSIETAGLPWDPSWGVDTREYVDSPSPTAAPLKGLLSTQILKDPRVVSVTSTVDIQDFDTFINLQPVLTGGVPAQPVSVQVPNS